jgi:hypothetical protein
MSTSVDQAYVNTYESIVRHLAQQGTTRLRPWVQERSVQSEAHNWERMASTAAASKAAGVVATPDDNTEWSRRVSQPATFHTGDTTQHEDIVQMIVDPNSNYARAQGMAMRRAHDDSIIAAMSGTALDGDGNAVVFPVGNVSATNPNGLNQVVGDGTTELTFDAVTEVTELFMANDVDPDDQKVMVIGPKQARKLLQLTEATSGDYNAMRPLTAKGYVESWMGYTWILSNRLPNPDTTDGDIECFAMTKRAMGFQVNKDIWARISEDPSISYAWRVYCASTFGCVRVEDEQIVKLFLADTV